MFSLYDSTKNTISTKETKQTIKIRPKQGKKSGNVRMKNKEGLVALKGFLKTIKLKWIYEWTEFSSILL